MNQQDNDKIQTELVKIWDTLDLPKAMITMVAKRIYQMGYDRAIAERQNAAVCIENPNGYRGEWPTVQQYRRGSVFADAAVIWTEYDADELPGHWIPTGKTAQIVEEEQKCLAEN